MDESDLGAQLESFRPRLKRMVSLRMDPRLRRRIDSSDILQDAFAVAAKRIGEYELSPTVSLFLWVRQLTSQKLIDYQRKHLGAVRRDVRREVGGVASPGHSSASLARAFVDQGESPSEILMREEREARLRDALEGMKETDREVLMLRHFEWLTHQECADVIGISLSATKVRYLRALGRLREILRADEDLMEAFGNE